jgi:hypothetical protein
MHARSIWKWNDKVTGTMAGSIFRKRVRRSRHFHRQLQGWGHDKSQLEELARSGCKIFRVEDIENNQVYEVNLDKFLRCGIERDYGFGSQLFLRETEWRLVDSSQLALFIGGA